MVPLSWRGLIILFVVNGMVFPAIIYIPDSIYMVEALIWSGLDQLKLLDLSFNNLEGDISIELSNLQKLEVLDLSYYMLFGLVSQVLGGLTSILSLNISNNFFTGGLLEIDAYLNLAVLNISGELPRRLTNLKSLTSPNGCTNVAASVGIPFYVKHNQSANGLQYN
ncbi:hypothetical protein IFM89_019863 [Coptis chinensis]|uniref:Uncharacterized protein n=1 Tax=Coptis chinensis TaxID=261450 RepID=A0A835IZK0_9MAGN|nr:hypothetical protein IFM89_019863 [Coptis chinensis]